MTEKYKYIVVGAGVAGAFAVQELVEKDSQSSILLVGQESFKPYERPPLSKYLWEGETDEDSIFYDIPEQVDVLTDTQVTAIDRQMKTIETNQGQTFSYEKLMLATGGLPRRLSGPESERVMTYRSLADYKHLRSLLHEDSKVILAGGGFIGCEVAASMREVDVQSSIIYSGDLLGEKLFPEEIARDYTQLFVDRGVELIKGKRVEGYHLEDSKVIVQTNDGQEYRADVLVLGLGIEANTALAEECGLEVDNGVVVNEFFQTRDADIYAVGDIANYPDQVQGRTRLEHVDHARMSAKIAARNMVGQKQAYTYIPLFYSDVFDNEWEGYGLLDSRLDMVIEDLGNARLVYYLDGDQPKGFLNYNIYTNRKQIRSFLKEDHVDPSQVKSRVKE